MSVYLIPYHEDKTTTSPIILTIPNHPTVKKQECIDLPYTRRTVGNTKAELGIREIADNIQKIIQCSINRAIFPRDLLAYNQPINPEQTPELRTLYPPFADDRLQKVYLDYHEINQNLIKQAIAHHGIEKVLLIDLHGFDIDINNRTDDRKQDIIIGTLGGLTAPQNLIEKIQKGLGKNNYSTLIQTTEGFSSGGYTILYSHKEFKIASIQMSISGKYRKHNEHSKTLGKKLAKDIAEVLKTL